MNRRIYLAVGILVVALFGMFLYRGTDPVAHMVQVSGDGPWQHRDTLRVGNTYYLRVLGDSLMGEGISWIYEPDGDEGPQNPDRNTPRPKFSVR